MPRTFWKKRPQSGKACFSPSASLPVFMHTRNSTFKPHTPMLKVSCTQQASQVAIAISKAASMWFMTQKKENISGHPPWPVPHGEHNLEDSGCAIQIKTGNKFQSAVPWGLGQIKIKFTDGINWGPQDCNTLEPTAAGPQSAEETLTTSIRQLDLHSNLYPVKNAAVGGGHIASSFSKHGCRAGEGHTC